MFIHKDKIRVELKIRGLYWIPLQFETPHKWEDRMVEKINRYFNTSIFPDISSKKLESII